MSCKFLRTKLFICGLHIIFVLYTLAECKNNEYDDHIQKRFFHLFGDTNKICNSVCGTPKFLFSSAVKHFCEHKCPNTTTTAGSSTTPITSATTSTTTTKPAGKPVEEDTSPGTPDKGQTNNESSGGGPTKPEMPSTTKKPNPDKEKPDKEDKPNTDVVDKPTTPEKETPGPQPSTQETTTTFATSTFRTN